jgi:tetratricopeptide (TPR) repeat protein
VKTRPFKAILLAIIAAHAVGCATYSDITADARMEAGAGRYDEATRLFDKRLGVKDPGEIPDRIKSNEALMLLERGTLLQAQQDYENSKKNFSAADKELELLDIASDPAGSIGRYIYSDSAAKYRISPVERLSLNAMNLMNYLATDDLRGARIEARRFTTMRDYMVNFDPEHAHGPVGSYLSGFVMEKLGESNSALRYYDEALEYRHFKSLEEPIARLAETNSYRGKRIDGFLERANAPLDSGGGEILTFVTMGRVPHKEPKRIPIGLAVGIAGAFVTGNAKILERSVFKVVVYPELVAAAGTRFSPVVTIDGEAHPVELAGDLGNEVTREYQELKPKIIGAALSRMIARAVVAEGTRQAGNQAGGIWSVIGLIASFATEGAMVAADKPDTRSWTLLPDRVYVSRVRVPAGTHRVAAAVNGSFGTLASSEVEVPEGGFAVVVVTSLR